MAGDSVVVHDPVHAGCIGFLQMTELYLAASRWWQAFGGQRPAGSQCLDHSTTA